MITRRSLFISAAPSAIVAGALALAGCTTTVNPTTGVSTYGLDPTVVADIQNVVAAVVAYTPSIESIAAIAASLAGPGYAAIVTAGSSVVNQIEAALEGVVSGLAPVASSRLRGRLMAAAPGAKVLVGYATVGGKSVPVFSGPHI